MNNFKAIIAYCGTHYLGWQKTKEGPSIEESVEKAFSQILQEKITLQAASRTDRGVHAHGQVINFLTEKQGIDLSTLKKGVQAVLPRDISLLYLESAPEQFHPTLDCTSKEYQYFLCNDSFQLPFHRDYSWHWPYPLNLELMQKAAEQLQGKHDFSAFTNERLEDSKDAVREIYSFRVVPLPEHRFKFSVTGNRFLYKMVRNLVGTVVYIGAGKISLENLPLIIKSRDRTQAGITAPAYGLSLKEVFY